MDSLIQSVIAGMNTQTRDSDSDSDGSNGDPMDMLISGEGTWIHGNHHNLMRIWRALKCASKQAMPEHKGLLAHATFRVFASFMYRWTAEEEQDDDDTEVILTETGQPEGQSALLQQQQQQPQPAPRPEEQVQERTAAPSMQSQ